MTPDPAVVDIARRFGQALDRDDFALAATFIADDCRYAAGDTTFVGPADICGDYEKQMRDGRARFDALRWGDCEVTAVDERRADILYVDYVGHAGVEHVYRCTQRVTIDDGGRIVHIEHIEMPGERERFEAFLERVGLADR